MKRFFRRFRFYHNVIRVFWQKRKKLFILGFSLGIFVFLLFYKILSLPKNTIEEIGLVGKYTINELPLEIQNLISDGLTEITKDGSAKPKIAESWAIENNGKDYVFKIKDGLTWQDGEPLTAWDINLKFSDVTKTVLDDKTIKFQLKEEFSPFPMVVSQPIFRKGLLGTGEYKVKKIERNGEIIEKLTLVPVLDRNKPKIIYRFYPTEQAARTGFKLAEVFTLKEIVRLEDLEDWQRVEIKPEVKSNRFIAIFLNTSDPHLGSKATRQALAYAINKDKGNRALSPINPTSWAYNKDVKPYKYDLANAKKLLENDATGEETEVHNQPLKEIELATLSSLLPMAEEIKNDWEQLGIETRIRVINNPSEEFQALLATQEIPADPDQYAFWHSTQMGNITNYQSPKLDKLLEDGRKLTDQNERQAVYFDFQKTLVEDTPVIFLYHPTVYTISKK